MLDVWLDSECASAMIPSVDIADKRILQFNWNREEFKNSKKNKSQESLLNPCFWI